MATGITRRKTRQHDTVRGPEPQPPSARAWGPGWGASGPTEDELRRERLWQDLIQDGWRAEIVGGRIIVSPWAKRRHGVLLDRLADQLYDVKRKNGWEFHQCWAVHIPPERGDKRLPDLLIAPPDCPEFDDNRAYGYGTLMAVEVISSDSRHDDLTIKPAEYARAGIPVMLILDDFSERPSVRLLCDLFAGRYQTSVIAESGQPLELPEPFGIKLETDLIFR